MSARRGRHGALSVPRPASERSLDRVSSSEQSFDSQNWAGHQRRSLALSAERRSRDSPPSGVSLRESDQRAEPDQPDARGARSETSTHLFTPSKRRHLRCLAVRPCTGKRRRRHSPSGGLSPTPPPRLAVWPIPFSGASSRYLAHEAAQDVPHRGCDAPRRRDPPAPLLAACTVAPRRARRSRFQNPRRRRQPKRRPRSRPTLRPPSRPRPKLRARQRDLPSRGATEGQTRQSWPHQLARPLAGEPRSASRQEGTEAGGAARAIGIARPFRVVARA
jgi:hypothetical protein